METNALDGADTIDIPAGTFTLVIDGTDDDGALGDLDIVSSELTINGAGADSTILDANGIDRLFDLSAASVEINDLTIRGGRTDADASVGGAIALTSALVNPNSLTLRRVHLLDNGAKQGGGIRAATNAVVVIEDALIQGNVTTDVGVGNRIGAALYCLGCTMTLESSTVTGNGDDLSGKVIEVDSGGQLNILNSTISGNPFGGGIRSSGGNVLIKSSTIVNNAAQNLSFFSFDMSESFEVGNSVLQSATSDNCQSTNHVYTSLGYNVVSDATCTFATTGDVESADALLGSLQDNGGLTVTHRPSASSPAIDRVPLGACTDLNDNPLAVDQRGDARPAGSQCDSGAVEVSEFFIFGDGFEDLP